MKTIPELESKLTAQLQLKADMFDYICWLEHIQCPAELRGCFVCLASDGTPCGGKTFAEAVRVSMEYDKGLKDSADNKAL